VTYPDQEYVPDTFDDDRRNARVGYSIVFLKSLVGAPAWYRWLMRRARFSHIWIFYNDGVSTIWLNQTWLGLQLRSVAVAPSDDFMLELAKRGYYVLGPYQPGQSRPRILPFLTCVSLACSILGLSWTVWFPDRLFKTLTACSAATLEVTASDSPKDSIAEPDREAAQAPSSGRAIQATSARRTPQEPEGGTRSRWPPRPWR
jgi:hypothetical protein